MNFLRSITILIFLFTVSYADKLELGAKAPIIKVSKWMVGESELKFGDGKTIYVLDVWGSWCKPCRESVAHLNKLQEKFKDKNVVIIGLSNASVSKIEDYISKVAGGVKYKIAQDANNCMYDFYMKPLGVTTIPHTFIIDKNGCLVWHGNPLGDLEEVINKVVSGKDTFKNAKILMNMRKYQAEYIAMLLKKDCDKQKAQKKAIVIIQEFRTNSSILNEFAWFILVDKHIEKPDYKVAYWFAYYAARASKYKDPIVLDTYALALFKLKRYQEAVSWQEKAIKLAANDKIVKESLLAPLKKYKEALQSFQKSRNSSPK